MDQVVRASKVSRMAEQQDAMQVRTLPNRSGLPAKGTSIEVQWTVRDENYLNWFTAVAVKPNVTQTQARQEKRNERRAKCHQIRYTMPPNEIAQAPNSVKKHFLSSACLLLVAAHGGRALLTHNHWQPTR